jgi:succinoglycan biosynthesis protein ExoM
MLIRRKLEHICVCVATYRRPALLDILLHSLIGQVTMGKFTYSIVVVDNDVLHSAEEIVRRYSRGAAVTIVYAVEERKNIAYARNKSLSLAKGDYVAFTDDDCRVTSRWLYTLYCAAREHNADVVHGPRYPLFEEGVPNWVKRSKFFLQDDLPTGTSRYESMGTNNCLIRCSCLPPGPEVFSPEFGLTGGEDRLLFILLLKKNLRFAWSAEGYVYEFVPRCRAKLSWIIRRSFREGNTNMLIFKKTESRRAVGCRLLRILAGFAGGCLCGPVLIIYLLSVRAYKSLCYGWRRMFMDIGEVCALFNVRYKEYA